MHSQDEPANADQPRQRGPDCDEGRLRERPAGDSESQDNG